MTVRYALSSDPEAAERLRAAARQEGAVAAKHARPSEVDFELLRRDARTVLARHCGEPASGKPAGPVQFRWRDGGEYVDNWAQGTELFVKGYLDGYLNAALDTVGRNLPITSIPINVGGVGGVLRRSGGRYTAVVRYGDAKEPYTARAATAEQAVGGVASFVSAQTIG